eukprot:CAMPEP_0194440932 /NCGR_PEP_ID=MMETSP0176-20130528/118816_1 /TAXON_ID=216777 /ORGANISM="Proboscia alata, Strain PI-D3" /LENGTH=129 /DNA_ID=CAMNT_0039265735 /DNA_START=267 /DNA_END=653 /DNA_ORIENTATION=+
MVTRRGVWEGLISQKRACVIHGSMVAGVIQVVCLVAVVAHMLMDGEAPPLLECRAWVPCSVARFELFRHLSQLAECPPRSVRLEHVWQELPSGMRPWITSLFLLGIGIPGGGYRAIDGGIQRFDEIPHP